MVTHPGMSMNLDYRLGENHGFVTEADLGHYWHRDYSRNVFAITGIGYYFSIKEKNIVQIIAGPGWQAQRPDAAVWLYDNGTFTSDNSWWHFFVPSASLEYARLIDISESKNKIEISTGFRLYWQYPFNDQWMMHPVFQFGIQYYFAQEK